MTDFSDQFLLQKVINFLREVRLGEPFATTHKRDAEPRAYGLDLLGRGPPALLSSEPWIVAVSAPRGWGLLIGALRSISTGGTSKPTIMMYLSNATQHRTF